MRARAVVLLTAMLAVTACEGGPDSVAVDASGAVSELMSAPDIDGYARAVAPPSFEFPREHAAHPQFRTEWWYFTGNLDGAQARAFGFQLTFFRIALASADAESGSPWRSRQAWMAHLAITDPAADRFVHAERFSRDGLGLAGNSTAPFRIWVEDWSATAAGAEPFPLWLRASTPEAELDLTLVAAKAPVAHGNQGLDRKGPEPGNASYYYSIPRLRVDGVIRLGDVRHAVTGLAWMDREWSTNALSPDLAGWDWLSLQLSDGRDLMLYRLRTRAGRSSPFSGGTLILDDGSGIPLTREDFELEARDYWTSPATGTRYPVGWDLGLPAYDLHLAVRALIPNQEMDLTVRYWEGAVEARGAQGETGITGRGYLELAGY